MQFFAAPATRELCKTIAELAPANPMCTWAYVEAVQNLGATVKVIGLRGEFGMQAGCLASVRSGRLNRDLEIASLPVFPGGTANDFWEGLINYCRCEDVSSLALGTYGSEPVVIPQIPGENKRSPRWEFIIDLHDADLLMQLEVTHRRHVRKAEKHGVTFERTSSVGICDELTGLSQTSMQRRSDRGEDVPEHVDTRLARAMLATGAAEGFKAILNGQPVSIIIVMRAAKGGYLHASGTSSEGMKIGASHFLNHQISRALQEEDCAVYNLGGADDLESGLARFKRHFGTRVITLESVSAATGSRWKRSIGQLHTKLQGWLPGVR